MISCLAIVTLSLSACIARAFSSSASDWTADESYNLLQIIANITLDKEPLSIAVNEETNRVYVGVEGGIELVDGEIDEVVAEILPGSKVVALAVNPQSNLIYAGVYGEKIVVINGTTNLVLGEIPEGVYNSYEIAVDPISNLVYVADRTVVMGEYDRAQVYGGENLTLLTSVDIPGSNEHPYIEHVGVSVNPETSTIYATWSGNNTLHVIDGDTHEITRTISPSSFSRNVMVNLYTGYVYVGKAVLDGDTLEEVTSDYHGDLRAINDIDNLLYTTKSNDLYVLNDTTHGIIASLELHWWISSYSDPVTVNSKTGKIYIINHGDNQVSVIIPEFPAIISILLILIISTVSIIFRKRTVQS